MEPGELNPNTSLGTLAVNTYACFAPDRAISDMSALLDDAELRGGNRLIPHAVGTLPRRRRRTVTRKDFPMVFTGLYTPAGVRVPDLADRWLQLILNIEAFRNAIGIGEDAPAGDTGTVTATWTRPDASTLSAAVHVLSPLRVTVRIGAVATATLSLELPDGEFV